MSSGEQLRNLRQRLGLSVRDVERASLQIVARKKDSRYQVSRSAISEIEGNDAVPAVHKAYSLAAIYRQHLRDILQIFGIEDHGLDLATPSSISPSISLIPINSKMFAGPAIGPDTTLLGRSAAMSSRVAAQVFDPQLTFGYIGTSDRMMYPLLPPGSLVQIDEAQNVVVEGGWRNEYERPIYFLQSRERCFCCWCRRSSSGFLLIPHMLSPEPHRILGHRDLEVVGRVVAVAMRLDGSERPKWTSVRSAEIS